MMNGLETVLHGQKIFCRVIKNIKKSNLETLNKNPYVRFGWRWVKVVIRNRIFVLRNR